MRRKFLFRSAMLGALGLAAMPAAWSPARAQTAIGCTDAFETITAVTDVFHSGGVHANHHRFNSGRMGIV
jgi:hypothetical protein